jgi:PAS domain S-box-containing protein
MDRQTSIRTESCSVARCKRYWRWRAGRHRDVAATAFTQFVTPNAAHPVQPPQKEMILSSRDPVGFGSVAAAAFESKRAGKRTWTVWLPAGLSAALLMVIAAAFFWMSRRVESDRRLLESVLEPTSQRLTRFQLSFLDEIAAGRAFMIHPTAPGLATLRSSHQRTQNILNDLNANAGRVGPEFGRELASLNELFAAWAAAPDTMLAERASLDAFALRLPKQEGLAGSVIARAAQLDSADAIQTQTEMLHMRLLERRRLLVLGALFPLALLGTAMTAWFGRRAIQSQQEMLRTAAFEALLRDSMAALTGEEVLPVALNRIASNAMCVGDADCAFIEQADESRGEVEVVAAAGSNAPATGTHVPFTDSLTDALVRAGAPELVVNLSEHDGRVAFGQWTRGAAVAVPLQEGGSVNGALVLIRGDGLEAGSEMIVRLHTLGAWATVALRRKRLAAQLELEHSRLEAVITEVPVGVVLAEAPSGRVVSINRKAVDLWGSPTNPPRAIEDYSAWKVFHPDGQLYETEERPLPRAILKGETVQGEEAVIERIDGKRSVVQVNAAPIRDSHGVISAAVAAIVDVTEERKREEQARFLDDVSRQLASTLDYDATIQAALQMLVPRYADAASIHHREGDILLRRWDTSGTNAEYDRKFRELERDYPLQLPSAHPVAVAVRTGMPQLHEVVDETLLRTIARDEGELRKLMDLGIRSGMTVPLTVRGRTIGAMQFVSIHANRQYSCHDLEFAEEITRRVALAIDNAQLFRAVTDSSHMSTFLSDAALALSGSLEHDEVLSRVTRLALPFLADFTIAFLFDENGRPRHAASAHRDVSKELLLAEAAEQFHRDPARPSSTVIRALNTGRPVVVERVTAEVLDEQGIAGKARELVTALAPTSWMTIPLVARDKTIGAIVFASVNPDRRYGAEDVRVAQMLADRAALATQNALLYRKEHDALATRDEVLAIVSHDLRNPLHTIGMSAQLLLDVPGDEAQRMKHLQIVVRAKDRMDRLIQDLVDVVRIKNGKTLVIDIRRERPSPLLMEACERFVQAAREKNVDLRWEAPDDMPDVMVDHGRIVQVLTNLIGNALKFTPEGGGIVVRAERGGARHVRMSVRDSGPGIAAENLPRIFDAFWQAPRAARLGSGLGLTISRGIIQLHGGRIWAESREGVGSTFLFTLPATDSAREQVAAD